MRLELDVARKATITQMDMDQITSPISQSHESMESAEFTLKSNRVSFTTNTEYKSKVNDPKSSPTVSTHIEDSMMVDLDKVLVTIDEENDNVDEDNSTIKVDDVAMSIAMQVMNESGGHSGNGHLPPSANTTATDQFPYQKQTSESNVSAGHMTEAIQQETFHEKSCCDSIGRIWQRIVRKKRMKNKLHGFFCPYFMAVHWRLWNLAMSLLATIVAMPYMSDDGGLVKCFFVLFIRAFCIHFDFSVNL